MKKRSKSADATSYVNIMMSTTHLSVWYFIFYCLSIGGFACLPFLWLVNVIWFFEQAYILKAFVHQWEIKKCKYLCLIIYKSCISTCSRCHYNTLFFLDVTFSLIGVIVWTIIFATWTFIFQLNRVQWGELGDSLSFVYPRGMP